jgi:hypothetical protein
MRTEFIGRTRFEGWRACFGVLLKIHAKVALVVRQESEGLRCIAIGTGNYNQNTARLYEDLGLYPIPRSLAMSHSCSIISPGAPGAQIQRPGSAVEYARPFYRTDPGARSTTRPGAHYREDESA